MPSCCQVLSPEGELDKLEASRRKDWRKHFSKKKVLESFDDLVVVWGNGDFDYILHMRLIFSYFVLPGFSQGIAKETGESCADFFFFFVGLAKRIARKFEI